MIDIFILLNIITWQNCYIVILKNCHDIFFNVNILQNEFASMAIVNIPIFNILDLNFTLLHVGQTETTNRALTSSQRHISKRIIL